MCKTSSVLDSQEEKEQITTKVKGQLPFSCDAMVASIHQRGLQNDHSGRWRCQTTTVSSDLLFSSTTANHRRPAAWAQRPDSRLSSVTSPRKQTSKDMANQNTTCYSTSGPRGLIHMFPALWPACTSPDGGAPLNLQA